jgi:hypothetical protein
MKTPEIQIAKYCDFCSQKERSFWNCSLCGGDICDGHRFIVSIPRKVIRKGSPPDFSMDPTREVSDLLDRIIGSSETLRDPSRTSGAMGLRMEYSICPECTRRPMEEICFALNSQEKKDLSVDDLF